MRNVAIGAPALVALAALVAALAASACGLSSAGTLGEDEGGITIDASADHSITPTPDASQTDSTTTMDAPADVSFVDVVVTTKDAEPSDANPPDPGVTCGPNTYCTPPAKVCCLTTTTITCTMNGQCGGATLACDSTADCPGNNICCGELVPLKSSCHPTCGQGEAQLCDPNTNDCSDCSGVLGPIHYCK
ncbi:hypothetical protein BH09MYX1_BH09MYX1_57170 [soil metagenome]